MLSMLEYRMAFYGGLLRDGKLTLSPVEGEEWRAKLPAAIEKQHRILDRGGLPIVMSLANVRVLTSCVDSKYFGPPSAQAHPSEQKPTAHEPSSPVSDSDATQS